VAEKVAELTIEWVDASVFHDDKLRSLLSDAEFAELAANFKSEWLSDLSESVDRFRFRFSSSDQASLYRGFKDALEYAATFFDDEDVNVGLPAALGKLDELISETEEEQQSSQFSNNRAYVAEAPAELVALFADIDGTAEP
jgi:hypothetical protein